MTRSLQLTPSGDLALVGPSTQFVQGLEKLKQDLTIWLKERYQIDRFHRGYGSTLENFIGEVISQETEFYIKSEVLRVLNNFQQLQLRRIEEDPSIYAPNELLDEILGVETRQHLDSIIVTVRFRTARSVVGAITIETDLTNE